MTPPYANAGAGPSAGMTNAPFINSSPRPVKSSRGVLIASVGAALLGLSVGVLAIVKLVDHPSSGVAATTQPLPPASSAVAIETPPPVPSLDPLTPLAAPASASGTHAQGVHPSVAVVVKPGTKPSASPPPAATPQPVPVPPPPPPPHATSKPNTSDPGY
jgi:hypothetical protein